VAWLGASLVVLSDGRRGLALGVLLAGAGVAVVAFPTAGLGGSAALAVGGLVAATGRLVAGPPGWAILPAGSTPRLVLCIAGGLVALWVGLGVTSGDGASLRFGVISTIGFGAARVLSSHDQSVVLSALALISLAVGAAVGLAAPGSGVVPYVAAAVIAAGSAWIPIKAPSAA